MNNQTWRTGLGIDLKGGGVGNAIRYNVVDSTSHYGYSFLCAVRYDSLYGNILRGTSTYPDYSVIILYSCSPGANAAPFIANNTIYGGGTIMMYSQDAATPDGVFKNNIAYWLGGSNTRLDDTGNAWNYNMYYPDKCINNYWNNGSMDFSEWQGLGKDVNGSCDVDVGFDSAGAVNPRQGFKRSGVGVEISDEYGGRTWTQIGAIQNAADPRAIKTDSAGSTQTLQSLAPSSLDTVIVLDGDTLAIASTWLAGPTDTTALILYVRSGGVVSWTGDSSRANFGQVALGGETDAPFSSNDGGTLIMGPSDTVGLWGNNIMGLARGDFHIDQNATVDIDGGASSTKACILGMTGTAGIDMGAGENTNLPSISIEYCKFGRMYNTSSNGALYFGWQFNGTNFTFNYNVMDSCNVYMRVLNTKMTGDTLTNYAGAYSKALEFNQTSSCSLYQWHITTNGNAEVVTGMVCFDNDDSDSTVLYDCTIEGVNGIGMPDGFTFGGYTSGYLDRFQVTKTTMDGFQHGINQFWPIRDMLVDSNTFGNNGTGEHWLKKFQIEDTASTIIVQGNTFYKNFAGAIMWEFYDHLIGDTIYGDFRFLYNTFADTGTGIFFRARTAAGVGTRYLKDVTIVGNIAYGEAAGEYGIRTSGEAPGDTIIVICDDFKYNALDVINTGNGDTIRIAADAYPLIPDSNNIGANEFGFVDSTNHDYRLIAGSPMLNAGEGIYCDEAFGASGPDCNLGYYQGAGVGAEIPTAIKAPFKK